ncbi:ESX-1 secretion-associated regulator EspR [Mycobacteroides abscessus subsp. bolletii]|nr:helix-turn-helix transcriptional regulator [Mycobacteroides abscessus]SKF70622.1 ESX-1 secretion-associated regulator EspR [Mycobacteroides abscessus subsp. bolletii]SKF73414.1 ESX-1 secretion-associated regulator EspR [Mycobacteroides abscessus subsp. bolletii]SKH74398.1 ESX-1 secretion-associated regulator EspR [Mycobacteroides abscessus subsp. bolletii]SKH93558.1 ESX-1 secretion-associated regulator EspR [Mycobacteroides abscessus subsp. bolletii]SKH97832.1 ESX-1 secretion-associated reg
MSVPAEDWSRQFAQRLRHLFETVYPAGRGPLSLSEVSAGLAARGVEVSVPYLSLLRRGERVNPAPEIVAALAEFFQVNPAYFYNAEYAESVDRDLGWLVTLRDLEVREIATRSYALSPESRRVVADIVERLCDVEGVSPDGPASVDD